MRVPELKHPLPPLHSFVPITQAFLGSQVSAKKAVRGQAVKGE